MKDFMLIIAAIIGFAISYSEGYKARPELTYSEKRAIAIEFVCHEKWKGMRNFCGNLPPADRKDEK